jgi:hypothetical protein
MLPHSATRREWRRQGVGAWPSELVATRVERVRELYTSDLAALEEAHLRSRKPGLVRRARSGVGTPPEGRRADPLGKGDGCGPQERLREERERQAELVAAEPVCHRLPDEVGTGGVFTDRP